MAQPDNPSNVTTHFQLVGGLPVWTYELEGTTIVKRLIMPRLQNTVLVRYAVTRAHAPIRLDPPASSRAST